MAREPAERYADMRAMAEDLRAFLENRVVRAYRTGALVELKKWVARNRAVAASAALVLLVAGVAAVWVNAAERRRAAVLREDYQRALAARLVQQLERRWVVEPGSAPEMSRWVAEAEGLLEARAQDLERALQAVPASPAAGNDRMRNFEDFIREAGEYSRQDEARLAAEELEPAERRRLEANVATLAAELPEFERRIEREALLVAVERLEEFEANLLTLHTALPEVHEAADLAEDLVRRTVEERAADWEDCSASIVDRALCPLYEGLVLEPLAGLIPLRRNPASGLWEFWLWLSGDEPVADGEGDWRIGPSTGMVMILVPGARSFQIGAQATDQGLPHYDPQAHVPGRAGSGSRARALLPLALRDDAGPVVPPDGRMAEPDAPGTRLQGDDALHALASGRASEPAAGGARARRVGSRASDRGPVGARCPRRH